jgi:hypothetical protein
MTGDTPNPLDKLLRQWADGRTANDAELDQLKQRIVANLRREPQESADGSEADRLTRSRTPRHGDRGIWTSILGVAAGVLVMVGALWLWHQKSGPDEPIALENELPPAYAWLQEGQLRDKAVLLREMESIFDRRTIWLAETGESIDVGVVNRSTPAETKPVAVRIVVERRRAAESKWTPVWAMDVIARSEEMVRLTPKSSFAARLEMWSYLLPDGMIAVDTNLTLDDSTGVQMTISSLQSDGWPVEVYSAHVDGSEIRVFQSAAVLKGPVS